jgi:hypothetical protein
MYTVRWSFLRNYMTHQCHEENQFTGKFKHTVAMAVPNRTNRPVSNNLATIFVFSHPVNFLTASLDSFIKRKIFLWLLYMYKLVQLIDHLKTRHKCPDNQIPVQFY